MDYDFEMAVVVVAQIMADALTIWEKLGRVEDTKVGPVVSSPLTPPSPFFSLLIPSGRTALIILHFLHFCRMFRDQNHVKTLKLTLHIPPS